MEKEVESINSFFEDFLGDDLPSGKSYMIMKVYLMLIYRDNLILPVDHQMSCEIVGPI